MSINLDPSLIHTFRSKAIQVNRNFKNVDGKNLWNVLCSAMDWIEVTAEELPHIRLEVRRTGADHSQTLQLMQYIVAIDNMCEAIRQIYRVLFGNKYYPLHDDRSVFRQRKVSDDVYFKHIRAVFSTHPVNLDSLDGIKQDKNQRYYAGWTACNIGKFDYSVFLRSNNPSNQENFHFGINIQDLNRYAEKRYFLLQELSDQLSTIINKTH